MKTDSIKEFNIKVQKLRVLKEHKMLSEKDYLEIKEKLLTQVEISEVKNWLLKTICQRYK